MAIKEDITIITQEIGRIADNIVEQAAELEGLKTRLRLLAARADSEQPAHAPRGREPVVRAPQDKRNTKSVQRLKVPWGELRGIILEEVNRRGAMSPEQLKVYLDGLGMPRARTRCSTMLGDLVREGELVRVELGWYKAKGGDE